MFIGHFAVGFGAKKAAPSVSLGTLIMAAQFIDLLWPLFILIGIERVAIDPGNTAFTPFDFMYYPFSHSLVGVVIWGVLFGGVYYLVRRNGRMAFLLGGLVVSHWVLDLFVHRPDLPLVFGSETKVGFGLWNSVALTLVLESAIFVVGVWLYLRATRAVNRAGRAGIWGLIVFLAVAYVLNAFGPPPEAVEPIAIIGLSQWLLVWAAYWIDRNRVVHLS